MKKLLIILSLFSLFSLEAMNRDEEGRDIVESLARYTEVCHICRGPLDDGCRITNGLTQYGCSAMHVYHLVCLNRYKKRSDYDGMCPVCRENKSADSYLSEVDCNLGEGSFPGSQSCDSMNSNEEEG